MMNIILQAIMFISIIAFGIQSILFYYLEVSNDYDDAPYLKINFAIFTYYNKNVKAKDILIKKIRNILLKLGAYSFVLFFVGGLIAQFI